MNENKNRDCKMDIEEILKDLESYLIEIAKNIIKRNKRLPVPIKNDFLINYDKKEHHDIKWHQWGILTHSKKFRDS